MIPPFKMWVWPTYRVTVGGASLWLPPGEGSILALLASSHHAGRCLPMAEVIEGVFLSADPDREPEHAETAIRVYVCRLRRRLAKINAGFTIAVDRAGYHLAAHRAGQRVAIGRPGRRRPPAAPQRLIAIGERP
jgi:DNA-binding response OmpR family regulator